MLRRARVEHQLQVAAVEYGKSIRKAVQLSILVSYDPWPVRLIVDSAVVASLTLLLLGFWL